MRSLLHLDEFALHVFVDFLAGQFPLPDLSLDNFNFAGLFVDLYGDKFVDVGLDEEVEGLFPFGVNLSLEFGEAMLGAAVEGSEDGHNFEFLFVFAWDLELLIEAGSPGLVQKYVQSFHDLVISGNSFFLGLEIKILIIFVGGGGRDRYQVSTIIVILF